MSKQTVFYGSLCALTNRWMDLFGYFAPAVVTDTQREYRAVRQTAGLMDFSMLRKVDLDGEGALELVDSIVCRDVSTLAPGRIAYGPLCDVDGKMVDDCTVMPRSSGGDRVRFCGANDRDYEIFLAAADGLGIEVRERTDELPHLCLQGPRSRAILQNMTDHRLVVTGVPLLHVPRGCGDRGDPGVHDPARIHSRARLRALGRPRPRARPLGRASG